MTTPTADRRALDGAGPLWRRLADHLRQRVADGDFRDTFPGELALAEQYGVSRHTVRAALRGLREAGLVTASRGRPSHVAPPTLIEQHTSSLYSLFTAVQEAGLPQRSVVRRLDLRADSVAAAELGVDAGTTLFHLERLRFAGDRPLAVDRVWLHIDDAHDAGSDCAADLLAADFTDGSLYGHLRDVCGMRITGGRERVRAEVPSDACCADLAIDRSVAVLAVDRLGVAGDRPVEWRQTTLRGDLFSLTAQYPPTSPAAP